MKFVCITTQGDLLTGMRLAGADGTLVTNRSQALFALNTAAQDPTVALVLICPEVSRLLQEEAQYMKLHCQRPLLLEIPTPGEPLETLLEPQRKGE